MRTRLFAAVAVICCVLPAWSTELTATQTDWSDGPGNQGPVHEWGKQFFSAENVSWTAIEGKVVLATTAAPNPERAPFPGMGSGAIKIHSADIDLDGDFDVLGASYYGDEIVLFINNGSQPPSWERQVVEGGFVEALAVAVADIDNDGLPDILGGSDAGAEVVWWRNLGGSPPMWSRHTIDDQVPGAHDVAGADLDGDGDLDIVSVSYEDDEILWWKNDGGTQTDWPRSFIATGFDYPTKVAIADVDLDGDKDIFSVAWRGQQVAWWRNDGGEPIAWSFEAIEEGFVGAHWVDAADINGDGWIDVVGAAMDLRQIAWWQNGGAGTGSWEKHIVTNGLSGAVSVASADIDGDGDVDIAGAGWSNSGGTAWFENIDGQGLEWQRRTIDRDFDQSSSVDIADVDGNGALDVLGSSWGINQYAWWRVGDFVDEGSLTSSILDTGGTIDWIDCGRDQTQPTSTLMTMETRSSHDVQNMGPWVAFTPGPGCPGLLDGARYLQYRVLLDSQSDVASPILDEIRFSWEPRGLPAPRRGTGRVAP